MKLSIKKSRLGLMTLMLSTLIANAAPIGIAGADQNLTITASNIAVLLEATTVPNAVEYKWTEGATFIGPHMSRWYVIDEVGSHTITLDAYDAAGSVISSDTMNVNVSFANTSNTNILSADAGLETMEHIVTPSNRQVHLVGTATEGTSEIVSEEWFVDGTKIWDGASRWYTLVTPGEYVFTFKVTAANGSVETDTMIVTVVNPEVSILTANAGLDRTHTVSASNTAIHLNGIATDTDDNIVKYEWFQDDVFIGLGTSRWHILTVAGTYVFKFKVTDADGNMAEDTMTVTVVNGNI